MMNACALVRRARYEDVADTGVVGNSR